MVDFYNLLGVSPQSTPEAIKSAYRSKARQCHPDANPGASPKEKEVLKKKFIQLAQAYEILGDSEKKSAYDKQVHQKQRDNTGPTSRAGRGSGEDKEFGFKNQQKSRTGQSSGFDKEPDLDDLMEDVNSLLDRFGLTLSQPFEEVLDALWQWALALYQSVVEAWEQSAEAEAHPNGENTGTARKGDKPQHERPQPDKPTGPDQNSVNNQDIEEELTRLKNKLGKKP